nr:histone deacetylase 14 [Tanacetum cinerariifolium]
MATLIVIPSIRFTKLIIHHLQKKHRFHLRPDSPHHLSNEEPVLGYLKFSAKGTKSEVFGVPIPDSLITAEIQQATYYGEYLAKVTHHRKYLAGETRVFRTHLHRSSLSPPGSPRHLQDHLSQYQLHQHSLHPHQLQPNHKKINASTPQKQLTSPLKPKGLNIAFLARHASPEVLQSLWVRQRLTAEEPQVADEDADYQKAVEESMKDAYALPKGSLPPVVIRKPELGKYQPLPEVSGNGKAKVIEEQSDNEEELEKVVLGAEEGGQDEGQAGPDPDAQAEDQTESDAGAQAEGQAVLNPDETSVGQARSNPDETSKGQAGPDPGDAEAKV